MTKHPIATRAMKLLDVERGGKGRREVTAYASTFDDPYRVVDEEGDYDESIRSTAWNRHLSQHGIGGVRVMFNHGMTIWRTASDKFAAPIGTPLEIKPDKHGLITVTRYANSELADEALEMWDSGAIRAQSWRGAKIHAVRGSRNGRPLIERTELGLMEYGPAIFAANDNATLVAMRNTLLLEQVADMPPDERAELLNILNTAGTSDTSSVEEPVADPPVADTPPEPPEVAEPDPSIEIQLLANANRRRRNS